MTRPLLDVKNLRKSFGGIIASDGIMLNVNRGELHAIIGPNGAGKTTLISQLAGELIPDEGSIEFNGQDVSRLAQWRRSRLGLARSYQITSVFKDLTVLDNVALAAQAHAGHSFSFWKDTRRDAQLRHPARKVLLQVGLGGRENAKVARLSHGEHRQLEIAMALATKPRMLLLDEPMAGMGSDESARLVELLKVLKGQYTILLIEHDMEAVFALADRISVLVYGRVIASGLPDEIHNNQDVRRAYLGEEKSVKNA